MVYIFGSFFIFSIIVIWQKFNFSQKLQLPPPPHSPPQFLRACFMNTNCYSIKKFIQSTSLCAKETMQQFNFLVYIKLWNKKRENNARWLQCSNAKISPNFMVWKFCGNPQFPQCFGRRNSRKLGISTKFLLPGISWNFSILRSVSFLKNVKPIRATVPWDIVDQM